MAFDRSRQRIVLFGGYTDAGAILGDTWEWNGAAWAQVTPTASPPARWGHALSWDGNRNQVVAFGGSSQPYANNSVRNDTWAFDGATWTPVVTNLVPPGRIRIEQAMTFDAARQSVVLFGGRAGDVAPQDNALNDTWELTASGWRPVLSFAQSPVNGHRYALTPPMSWQHAEAVAVSYGGHLATIRNAAENTWLLQNYAGPNLGPWIGLTDVATEGVYAWSSGEPLSFTGWAPMQPDNGGGAEDYVHLLGTTGWNDFCPWGCLPLPGIIEIPGGPTAPITSTALTASAPPPPLRGHALAPLPSNDGALLFGGDTANGPQFGTYELQGTAWTKRFSLLNPMARRDHALAVDPARQTNVLFGGRNPLGLVLGDTWTWSGGQWAYVPTAGGPSPRHGHRMAYEPATQTVLLFGGVDASGQPLSDCWRWNGSAWSAVAPATAPSARAHFGLAFDQRRQRLVLHGGEAGSSRLADLWEWDGTTWTQPPQPNNWQPTARSRQACAYDPRAERVVVFGGDDGTSCANDAWSWDGVEWTRHVGNGLPAARAGASLVHDATANELRLFAGACGTNVANDLFRLDLPVFARSETYGQGCVGTLGVPMMAIEAPSRPLVGTTLNLRFTGVPGQFIPAIGAYGEQRDTYVGIPLPLDLGLVGLPGCTLWTSAEETFVLPTPNGTGSVLWAVAIPNDPLLLGTSSYFQGLAFELPGYPRWASMSNAVGVRIGNQ